MVTGDSKGYGKMSEAFRVWDTICFYNSKGDFQLSKVLLIAELVGVIFGKWKFNFHTYYYLGDQGLQTEDHLIYGALSTKRCF